MLLVCIFFLQLILCDSTLICPEFCFCYSHGSHLVACNDKNLTFVPTIHKSVNELYLRGNNFRKIRKGDFKKFLYLSTLDLRKSGIQYIEADSFRGLTLKYLDLRLNQINRILANTFTSLKCESLKLDSNLIEHIQTRSFHKANIKVLSLTSNGLTFVNPTAFQKCRIENLLLRNCSIRSTSALKPLKPSLKRFEWTYSKLPLILDVKSFQGFTFNFLNLTGNGISKLPFLKHLHVKVNLVKSYKIV